MEVKEWIKLPCLQTELGVSMIEIGLWVDDRVDCGVFDEVKDVAWV